MDLGPSRWAGRGGRWPLSCEAKRQRQSHQEVVAADHYLAGRDAGQSRGICRDKAGRLTGKGKNGKMGLQIADCG